VNEIVLTIMTVLNIFCATATIVLTLYNYHNRNEIERWLDEHDELYKQSLKELIDGVIKTKENKVIGDKNDTK